MFGCPARAQWAEFLEDRLPAVEQRELEAHAQGCSRCQRLLEDLTRPTTLDSTLTQQAPQNVTALPRAAPALEEDYRDHLAQLLCDGPPRVEDRRHPEQAARPLPTVTGYELLEELGRGGMGVVFKARQVGLNRLVALKMVLGGSAVDIEHVARFHREAEAVAQLQHPHIVQIYEIGTLEGQPYFAMEYVPGGSLDRHLQGQPQPPRDAAALVHTLAEAVQAAHDRGIIHRDLKPANILLGGNVAGWRGDASNSADTTALPHPLATAKITDFGLAKRLKDENGQTRTGEIVGTPSYMAPEQATGTPPRSASYQGEDGGVGPSADIYALGAMLYELLTGRPPFKGLTPMETVLQVLHAEPVPPRRLMPQLPRDLETICLKCLSKEPQQRYVTAASLAEDLRRFGANEPILARRSGWVEWGWKWAKRRPAVAGLLLGLMFVTLLGVVGITAALGYALAGWDEASRKEQEALHAGAAAQKARAHEAAMRQRADDEAETAKQVAQFLSGLFEDNDPLAMTERTFGQLQRPDHVLTAREVLDRGVKKLHTQLKDQPRMRAALLDKIGNVYLGLGEVAQAAPLLEEAYQLRMTFVGTDHPDVAASLQSVGWLHALQGKPDAEALCRRAAAMREHLLGSNHPLTAESLFYHGLTLLFNERFAEACTVLQRTWQIRCKTFGRSSREAAAALLVLSYALIRHGDVTSAVPCLMEVADLCDRLEGQNIGLIVRRGIRAYLAKVVGNLSQARDLLLETTDQSSTMLGKDHFVTILLQLQLSEIMYTQGDFAGAEQLYRHLLPKARKLRGLQHPYVGDLLLQLARCCYFQKRPEEALVFAQEAVALLQQHTDWNPQRLAANALRIQGWVRRDRGQWTAAETLIRDELWLRLQLRGPTHDTVQDTWGALALVLHCQGQRAAARQAGLEELACAQRLYHTPELAPALEQLERGWTFHQQGELSAALQSYLQAGTALEPLAARCPQNIWLRWQLPKLYARLGAVCATQGDREAARKWQQKYRAVLGKLPPAARTAADRYELAAVRAVGSTLFARSDLFTAEELAWGQAEQQAALTLLQAAVAAGFRDLALLDQDPDWTALRQREEYLRLRNALATQGK